MIYWKEGVQGKNFYKDKIIEKFRYNPYRLANRKRADSAYDKNEILSFPLHVIIEVSSLCQMKCDFCNREVMTRPQQNMDLDVFKKIVDECAENGVFSLSLYCLGEPFLNPDLREMIIYAKGKGIPYIDISTNGMLPMKSVLGTDLNEIIVSIDGFRSDHERLRKGSNFDQISVNTELLKKERDRMGMIYPIIRIQVINFKDSKGFEIDRSEFIDWAFGIGDVVYLKNIEVFSQSLGFKNAGEIEVRKRLAERKPCKQLWFVITVNSDGNIAYCCHDSQGKSVIGNTHRNLRSAWNGLDELRENHRKGIYTEICSQCCDYEW